MSREGYRERLDALREDVLYMSEVVLDQLRLGVNYPTYFAHHIRGSLVEGGALMWTPGDQLSAVGR